MQDRAFFDTLSEKERPRPHIREMIVRDQAKRFLERNDINVESIEEDNVLLGNEPLGAIVFRYGPVRIRILKRYSGTVPGCGESRERKKFYNQQPFFYIDRDGNADKTRLNLIILWDFDQNFNLEKLWLVCPSKAGVTAPQVAWYWFEPIPYPAVSSTSGGGRTSTLESPNGSDANGSGSAETDTELEKLLNDEREKDDQEADEA